MAVRVGADRETAWAVDRAGFGRTEAVHDLAGLRASVERQWFAHFPRRDGYVTVVEPVEGEVEGLRLCAVRGEFRAEIDLRCDLSERGAKIRVCSRADTQRLAAVARREAWRGPALRIAGTAAGLGLLTMLAVPLLGAAMASPLLCLMALAVIALLLPAGGFNLGSFAAERLDEIRRGAVLAETSCDPQLQHDFRRWRALSRQLNHQRRRLTRGRGLPFRREAPGG